MSRNRWTGLAGIVFGISFLFLGMYAGTTPDSGGADAVQKYADHFNDVTNQSHTTVSAFILTFSFLLLLGFAAGLRQRLRSVDTGPLPSLVLAAGTASAALLLVGGQISFAVGLTADQAESYKVDGATAMLMDGLGYQILAPGLMAAAVMAVTVGILTLRTKVLPAWTAWLGFLLGLTAVGSYVSAWAGFFALPVWSVVIGICLMLRADDGEPVAA